MKKTFVKTAMVLMVFFSTLMVGCSAEVKTEVTTDSTVTADTVKPTLDTTTVDTVVTSDTTAVK